MTKYILAAFVVVAIASVLSGTVTTAEPAPDAVIADAVGLNPVYKMTYAEWKAAHDAVLPCDDSAGRPCLCTNWLDEYRELNRIRDEFKAQGYNSFNAVRAADEVLDQMCAFANWENFITP